MSLPPSTAALYDHLSQAGIRLGTEATRRILRELGDPQEHTTVILVTGTNGKGSTAALLASMAVASGYRTGLYTSPHLEDIEEQIQIDGQAIDGEKLGLQLTQVLAAAGKVLEKPPTLFEAMTAAALLHFAEQSCQLSVLEAGMGGLRDATNATEPSLSIITSIGLDHRDHIGPSLQDIAMEKAGSFRPGRPGLVAGSVSAEAKEAIRSVASRIGAHLIIVPEHNKWLHRVESLGFEGQRVLFKTPYHAYTMDLPLLGEHQVQNLFLATTAAETLLGMGWDRFNPDTVSAGAAGCRWPGRIEPVHLASGKRVVLDAAHNPQAIERLTLFLDQGGQPFDLIFGVLADKDAAAMLSPLSRRAGYLWLTSPGGPRARDPRELPALLDSRPCVVEPQVETALEQALAHPSRMLVVCGSIVLIGKIRRLLRQSFGVPDRVIATAARYVPTRPAS